MRHFLGIGGDSKRGLDCGSRDIPWIFIAFNTDRRNPVSCFHNRLQIDPRFDVAKEINPCIPIIL